jgi:hypothetical protein
MQFAQLLRILMAVIIAVTCISSVLFADADSTGVAPPLHWERSTKAKQGVRVGLVAGGISGTGFFLLVGAAANSLCEVDCPSVKGFGWVGLGLLGAVTGAATGALLGGLFGSMIPDHDKHPSPMETGLARPPIASVSVDPGVGFTTERPENGSGFMLRATLIAQLKPWLGIGPEINYAHLAGGTYGFRGAVHLGPREPGLRPYVVPAIGWQHWKNGAFDTDVDVLQWGMGGGLAWTPGSPNAHIGLEARYEFSPQNVDQNKYFRFVSTSAMFRHSW